MCSDQFIVGSGGPIAINLVAVGYVLDNCFSEDIDKTDTIERIKQIASVVITMLHEEIRNG